MAQVAERSETSVVNRRNSRNRNRGFRMDVYSDLASLMDRKHDSEDRPEVLQRPGQPVGAVDGRVPAEEGLGAGDVGSSAPGVVLGQGLVGDPAPGPGDH